ncbi:4Fe-4S binding protein [Desulfovibrionales bacterium]
MQCIYFSPTRTTKTVVEAISSTLSNDPNTVLDLTLPDTVASSAGSGPVIIGMPVYGGRIPALGAQRLSEQVRGQGRPAVLVVVYGNRAFDDALLELRDLAEHLGFVPVAGAAFIGEHSFSTQACPVAPGRPDQEDMESARKFGQAVREKLAQVTDISTLPRLHVPGNFPYRHGVPTAAISPETLADVCVRCGACALVCPSGAITLTHDGIETEKSLCVRCCACVRACAYEARAMLDPKMVEFGQMLHAKFARRAQPEVFL